MAGWSGRAREPLFQMGVGLLVFSVALAAGSRAPAVVLAFLAAGLLLIIAAEYGSRLRRGKVGPGGLEFELDAQARSVTTAIAGSGVAPHNVSPGEADDATRWLLAELILLKLLHDPGEPVDDCRFQIWLFDPEQQRLLSILRSDHLSPPSGFAPHQGTVGVTWTTGEYVVATGAAVRDDTFGLSEDQKRSYEDLVVATSVPITNASGRIIGVLSGASRDPDSALATDDGLTAQIFLAEATARVLVDLLKWFSDGYDQPEGKEELWKRQSRGES